MYGVVVCGVVVCGGVGHGTMVCGAVPKAVLQEGNGWDVYQLVQVHTRGCV